MRRLVRALLALVVLVPTCGGVRRDEFLCEEAYARLVECCPGFSSNDLYCDYDSGCGVTKDPALSPEESDCVRGKTCDELRNQKVCERALQVQRPVNAPDAGQVTPKWSDRPAVCP